MKRPKDQVLSDRHRVSAYSASKAALDEILHSWRSERPELSIVRIVQLSPRIMTAQTSG